MCDQGDQGDQRSVDEGREPENQDAREEQELRVLLERAVPRLPAPEGRLLRVRERAGRIRRRRRATGAAALTVTGLVLAGTFLPGALRGSGPESEPVLPAAPVPSTSSRAVAHDGLVQFRNVAGLVLRLPEGWQALEAPPGFGYDEAPESVIPPDASTAPPDEATTAPPDKEQAPPGAAETAPPGGTTVAPSDGASSAGGARTRDSDAAYRATARGFASSQSLTSNAQDCAEKSGSTCLPVKELRRGAALLVLDPQTERGAFGKIKDPPALYEADAPSVTCEGIRGTREYNGLVGGAPAPFTAVAVSLCVSGDAPWTVEAVRSMIAGADFDKDPGEDSRKGAEPVPVPAAEHLRNKK